MRVFVLTTGRSGSVTFSKACSHVTNFTVGHESLASGRLFEARFDYPDQHIEVDNRLVWFLGQLGSQFGDSFFVHLSRDEELVAQSFLRRWRARPWRGSIIEAFAHGVLMNPAGWTPEEQLDVCRFYVQTVNRNIELFLEGKRGCVVSLDRVESDFRAFLNAIGAEGDLAAAMSEWDTLHNQSNG